MDSSGLPCRTRQKLDVSAVSTARNREDLPEDGSPPKIVPFTCTQVSLTTFEEQSDDTEQKSISRAGSM